MSDDGSDERDDDRADSQRDDFVLDEADDGESGGPFDDASEEKADPFERLGVPDSPDDRDRDPFAEIDDGPDPEHSASDPPSFDEFGFQRRGEEADSHAPSPASSEERADPSAGDRPDEPADDPFDRLGGGPRDGDPFEGLGEVGGPQAGEQFNDELWDDLSRSMAEPETEQRGQRRFAEVNKHSYCENCEYFSEPPDVECAHEGTDIVEFVDFETVRVADCPIVAEREELAEIDAE
ncbi:hypothetical protein HLRTI_000658 [Halorhabdus tiamatea SARL4B]|uniref:DUF8135 domain-containing protein n=1 Tax=Halorhabdus tiamatea SARL4B TaxID=1033806 RepID=F7PFY0_9EURY|nr:hypothetical protein [Halorhabdus tiamatea]ERJ07300.1 hypothetical protein HLRTI_000658 [Halorhabdus tiamatea SARL4B]CCQ34210.1 hypothetical protein HTIA_2096 [Halorhabdus tiamatea SARL4B]